MSLKIAAGFNYRGKQPNFTRDQFTYFAEMVAETVIDEGHVSYCLQTKKYYKFIKEGKVSPDSTFGYWEELGDTVETVADLLQYPTMGDGHITYVRAEQVHYIYDSRNESLSGIGKWRRIDESSVGSYSDGVPETSELDGAYIPVNGCNYNLGSITGLGLSVETPAMTLGCTILFTTATDAETFTIVVPVSYTYEDDQEVEHTIDPVCPSLLMNKETLSCLAGRTYLLHIATVKGASTQYYNMFTLSEVYEPTLASDNAVAINSI